jgi:pimeloyl-ACP methyl ester carboxylesterase
MRSGSLPASAFFLSVLATPGGAQPYVYVSGTAAGSVGVVDLQTNLLALVAGTVACAPALRPGPSMERGSSMWKRAALDGVDLEYAERGAGETVLFVHNGVGMDWFEPLVREPALARYRLVTYHRAGFGGSSPAAGSVGLEQEAAHLRALMHHLGVPRAHVVGHSSSALIALRLAIQEPDAVGSLALLEPALLVVPSPPEVPRAVEIYRAGDKAGAVDTFLRGTCGTDHRSVLEHALPGALDQALASADRFFGQELPALRAWTFGPSEAARVHTPALVVLGARSGAVHRERYQLLLGWLPAAEPFVLSDAGHLLHVQNPRSMARGLASFLARHPLAGGPAPPPRR